MLFLPFTASCCSALLALAVAGPDSTVTVGDPKNPKNLASALYQAYSGGAKDITIKAGTYDLPASGDDTLRLDGWNNTVIHAANVTLIFEELGHRPLHFNRCQSVTWDGGTLRFASPSYTQGRIKAVGTDAEGTYCDWQIDDGYATGINPVKSTFNIVDAQTRELKVGCGDWSPQSCGPAGPRLFRLHYSRPGGFAVGDFLVTRAPGGSTIAHMDACQNCTLEGVTLENGGFASFFETGGEGGNHYLKCRIQTGPRPVGATEDELVSCGADGLHSTGTTTGPDIEDCVFTGIFLDDCIAIHGSFGRVVNSSGSTLEIRDHAQDRPVVGEPLRISNMTGFFAQANCTAVEDLPNHDFQVTLDQSLNVPVDHTQNGDLHKGTKSNDPYHCGKGYKILRCQLGETRSRGILVKADDGVIDHCRIKGCAMSGVSIGPEFWWNEANYCWNVTVSNNTFINCSKGRDQGTLWVHGDGAIGNRNIAISNNSFQNCYGPYLLKVEDSDGVEISGNEIDGSFKEMSKIPGNILWVKECKNVDLLNNLVTNQGPFGGDLVALAPGMAPDEVKNNNPTGINLAPASPVSP